MSSASAAIAGTLVVGTLAAGVALDYDRRRRRQKWEKELEELRSRAEEVKKQASCARNDLYEAYMQHYSKVFGLKLHDLRQRLKDRKGDTLSNLPILGDTEPLDFVQAAVALLFGDAALVQNHWPEMCSFGSTIQSIHSAEPIITSWLSDLAREPGPLPTLHADEDEVFRLCLAQGPELCELHAQPRGAARAALQSLRQSLGFVCSSGHFVQGRGDSLEFHSKVEALGFAASEAGLWASNFEHPNTWSKRKGSTDTGFQVMGMKGEQKLVDCQVRRATAAQMQARAEFVAHVLLKRSAMEILRRLQAHMVHGLRGCTLEWCAAIAGDGLDLMPRLLFARDLDLSILQGGQLRRAMLRNLEAVVRASRAEIQQFVSSLVEYLQTQHYATKMLQTKAVIQTDLDAKLQHPKDLARHIRQSTFNAANEGHLSKQGLPAMLNESLRGLQELRESQRLSLEVAPIWWTLSLALTAVALALLLMTLISRMMFGFPTAAALTSSFQTWLWLRGVPLDGQGRSFHLLPLLPGVLIWLAASASYGWPVTLISLAMTAHVMFSLVWQRLPVHFLQISYSHMAQRFGWPMLIFRNLDALEAQLRQTLSLWRQRVAAEHLREHLRRGRISALQGIRFLEALEDVGEGVLPGSLEEAEAFLNLPVEEVDGRTELPDLSQSLHELEVNVAHQVDAAIEEAEELVMLGVEDDSDDEAAHPPADAAEPPDTADAEAEPKPRRRERKLETLLRRQGFHFERRKKRIIFRKSGASEQLFSATAKPKDPRHRPREVARLKRMSDPARDPWRRC